MSVHPHYGHVWFTFFRNALVRELTFRGHFLITVLTRAIWFAAQLTLFEIIYRNVDLIKDWTREEYFAFMATGMLINAVVETFFMPNCANFSELIRTGNLDFALLKPIDTQFLISFEKMDLAMLNQIILAGGLLGYSLFQIGEPIPLARALLYMAYLGIGVGFLYSMMIALASTSVWFGRNQGLYDFWFYITVFVRYPRSIYSGSPTGEVVRGLFSYVIPILLVVTVPARILVKSMDDWSLATIGAAATFLALVLSRRIFHWSLTCYRSASS
jgi:ABC-2 type transport system permease protein